MNDKENVEIVGRYGVDGSDNQKVGSTTAYY